MIPGLALHPNYVESLACETTACTSRHFPQASCVEDSCPFVYQRDRAAREAREDRARREEKDAARRAEG